jgi:hypothetical protein
VSDILHLSHSTLSDWKECGEKVRLRKVVKVPSTPSWSLIGGSLVHAVTEALDFRDFGIETDRPSEFNRESFDAAILHEEERSETTRDEWRASGRASKEWPDKENYDWWLKNGPKQVENWRRFITNGLWQVALTPAGEPAIEIGFDITMGQGEVPVLGYIDRVVEITGTHQLIVVDLKSGARDPMSDEQLGVYHVALHKQFGGNFTPDLGAYFMTRKGATTIPVDLTKYDDGRLEYDYNAVWTAMQAGVFVPKIGPLCGSCGVRDYCRAVDGPRAKEVLPY